MQHQATPMRVREQRRMRDRASILEQHPIFAEPAWSELVETALRSIGGVR